MIDLSLGTGCGGAPKGPSSQPGAVTGKTGEVSRESAGQQQEVSMVTWLFGITDAFFICACFIQFIYGNF